MTSTLNVGPETLVNTYTSSAQEDAKVTMLSDGSYIITWDSWGQDNYDPNSFDGQSGVYTQRYSAAGIKIGAETRVNTTVIADQFNAETVALNGGGYVVTWSGQIHDTVTGSDTYQAFYQIYNSSGVKVGGENQMTHILNGVYANSGARLADGSFVLTWSSYGQDGAGFGIYGQHYSSTGTKIGGELHMSTATADDQGQSVVTALGDGGWLVTWTSNLQDGDGQGIYAQHYGLNGAKLGGEFRVNTTTAYDQRDPDIAVLNDGTYVIVWTCAGFQGDLEVHAQRFNTDPLQLHKYGVETVINTTSANSQAIPKIAALTDGGYIVVWSSYGQDDPSSQFKGGIYAQRYDALGHAMGVEMLINTTVADTQTRPDVAALAGGGFVVTWDSYQDGSQEGVYSKTFTNAGSLNGSQIVFGTAGDDTLDGGFGADIMWGGYGNDTYVVDSAGDSVNEKPGEGTDTVMSGVHYTLSADLENLTLTGSVNINGTGNGADNIITGNINDNILSGLAGNDTLDGGAGNDNMFGGAGNDTYAVDSALDVISEETVVGTDDGGIDTVKAAITYTLGAELENLTLTGTSNIDGTGNALANTLTGNSGDNVLDGTAGGDTMAGGAGNDTYYVDSLFDIVTELPGGGTDTVYESLAVYTLTSDVENLVMTGAGVTQGIGNALNNTITGTAGINSLDGGAGADTMNGGAGDDQYAVDDIGDVVVEAVNAGTDTIYSYITFNLAGSEIEFLTLASAAGDINGYGNYLDNHMYGNAGMNTLTGGGGNDSIDGGAGADTLMGGAGNDSFFVDTAADVVTEYAGEGQDTVFSAVSLALGDNVENLVLTTAGAGQTGTGNVLNNAITSLTGGDDTLNGGAGDDGLNGGAGNDTMIGGLGDDTFTVDSTGDNVIEANGEGNDGINATVSYNLTGRFVENLFLKGTANIDATGNSQANGLYGNAGNNLLSGGGGIDVLNGGAGNDTIDGGTGADAMIGGDGDDTFTVDNIGDTVSENAGQGSDTVNSAQSFVLGDNIESLILTGTGNLNGTGNALNNMLKGNAGANVLDGGAGADTLTGGAGDDTYIVDNIADVAIEIANGGSDLVKASVTFTLAGQQIENLTLTGSANINGTGNSLANIITGNSGNNVINGGFGADTLTGGLGNDTYYVDNIGDVVTEASGQGTDLVISTISYSLAGKQVENLTLTTTAAIDATGNGLDNIINGNSGANTLNGGYGHDVLAGKAGADIFLFSTSSGLDTITDYAVAEGDTLNVHAYNNAAHTITQVGADTQIAFGANVITILNTQANDAGFLASIVW